MTNAQILETMRRIANNGVKGETTITFKSHKTEMRFRKAAARVGLKSYGRPNGQCSFMTKQTQAALDAARDNARAAREAYDAALDALDAADDAAVEAFYAAEAADAARAAREAYCAAREAYDAALDALDDAAAALAADRAEVVKV